MDRITANGIRVMAGFIIGFDGEKDGAGRRIVDFVTRTGIPAAMMGMLQALPNTALWYRLEKEGRLIQDKDAAKGVNQTNLLNFKPTRPIRDIANEYVEAFCALYEPNAYMDRVYSYYLKMGAPRWKGSTQLPTLTDLKALSIVIWRQGLKRSTRGRFWRYMFGMATVIRADIELRYLWLHFFHADGFSWFPRGHGYDEQIIADGDRDRWFTAAEALEYGFIDHIQEFASGSTGVGKGK